MARILTEEEVERLEKQRELQSRAQAATEPNALYNQRMAAAHAAAMERQRGYIERNPNAETNTALRHQVMRENELRAAHERGMQVHRGEWNTRVEEAEKKRLGMKEQGADAATIRANADKDMLGLTLGDKEKQRAHELAMLGQQQTFQGTQNDAERKNKLAIAQEQGDAAVDAATVQAQAQEARIYAENLMKTRNLDQRQAMQFARMREQKINKIMEQRRSKQTGKYTITREEAAKMADEELENQGLPGTARKTLADFGA